MTPPNDDLRTLLRVGALRILAAANAELGRIIDEANDRAREPDERVTVLRVRSVGARWVANAPSVSHADVFDAVIVRDGGEYHVYGWSEAGHRCSKHIGTRDSAEQALALLNAHAPTRARYGRLILPDKETT